MKKKDRINLMGNIVTVNHVLHMDERAADSSLGWSGPFVRNWTAQPVTPRAGWVVGFTHRRNGKTVFRGEEGPTFHPTSTVPCALVKYWPTLDAIAVPLDGFAPGGTPDNRHQRWPASAIAAARQESKSYPRRNGRFCKYVHATQRPS